MARQEKQRPERIAQLIGKVLEEAAGGTPPPPESIAAIELWARVASGGLAGNSRAVSLRSGKLQVEVRAPAWKQELMLNRRTIISKLNKLLGERLVADIVITVRDWIDG